MDIAELRKAHEDFLAVANGGGFGPPPPGEWDADRLLAHVAAADAAIASVALAITGGERAVYDNRASLDEVNLRRIMAECGDMTGLIEFVRFQGELFCQVAAGLPESALSVRVPVLIVSGDQLIVDEPWPLGELIQGIGAVHLPRHALQLAELRSS